ncbi:MAG: hypothetical protein DRP97_07235 [Candidatus Latescibacterota bacterium]|nr:MAG: hypothetical protein DRP97_07235 [Candidatus Latescibacterota bacterium]
MFRLVRKIGYPNLGCPRAGHRTWREFPDTKDEGIHHMAFRIEDMDDQVAILEKKGMPLVQRGDYTGGCYGYIDSAPQLGLILELLENY